MHLRCPTCTTAKELAKEHKFYPGAYMEFRSLNFNCWRILTHFPNKGRNDTINTVLPDFLFVSITCTGNVSPRVNRVLVSSTHTLHPESYADRDIYAAMLKCDKGSNVKNGPPLGALLLHWYCRIFQTDKCSMWIRDIWIGKQDLKSSCPSHCPGRFSWTSYMICNM